MPMMTLNAFRVLSARLVIPWRGVWFADLVLDPDDARLAAPILSAPTPAILTIGLFPMRGTIDVRGSGTFATKAAARIVGGNGGWDKSVPAQHFYLPSGTLLSTLVYAATAPLVLEPPPLDPLPQLFGKNFVRTAGPASAIFRDRDWHVDPTTGVAIVAPWIPLPLDPTAIISDFDIGQERAQVISDGPIFPGTILLDTRFNGSTFTVRDVEQTFNADGSNAECWCSSNASSRLTSAFTQAVRAAADTPHLKTYRYRFVAPIANQLVLQAITPGAPDLNPVDQWAGLAGASAKILPGTEIIVGFTGDNPPQPYLVSFSPLGAPLEIDLGPVPIPLATAPWAIALQAALTTFATGLNATTLSAQASALVTALAALPPGATTLLKGT